jgi:hypothetical protein
VIVIDAKIKGKSLLLSARAMRKVTKYCFYLLGKYWHEKILQKHFTTGAYSEYSYKYRSAKHQERKQKKFGHSLPNVFTGRMRDRVLSRANQDVRETSKGVRIHIHGPLYLYAYRKDYKQPDKAAELVAVSNRDRELMARFMQKHLRLEATKLTKRAGVDVGRSIGAQAG